MQITYSLLSFAGLLIMLGFGLVGLGFYQRWLYPLERERHEAAKVTGSHGRDPNFKKVLIKVFSLIILPALGFIFGDLVLSVFIR